MNILQRHSITFSAVLLLLFIGSVYAVHRQFTAIAVGANDFYPRWRGSQLFWREGVDPYSDTASEAIQMGMRGRLSAPDEDQLLFVYPFYTSFILLPLLGLEYAWVQAIWMVLLQFALAGSVFLIMRLLEWKVPLWLTAVIFIWSIFFYNSTRTIILGQFAGLVLLWLAGTLLALKHKQDVLAGILLSLTTVKPQMMFLLIPALLIWAVGQKRWRFMISSALSMAVLTGLSFLILPSWFTSFVTQVRAYPGYTVTPGPITLLTHDFFPQLGWPVEIMAILLLTGYLFYEWRRLPKLRVETADFLWLISLTLIVSNMILTRTATTNYIVMYIPLFMLLKYAGERWGNGWAALFFLLSIPSAWWLFLTTISGDFEHPINYLPMPLSLLMVMFALRPFFTTGENDHV